MSIISANCDAVIFAGVKTKPLISLVSTKIIFEKNKYPVSALYLETLIRSPIVNGDVAPFINE